MYALVLVTSLVVLCFEATSAGEGNSIASRVIRFDYCLTLKELLGEVFFGLVTGELSKLG